MGSALEYLRKRLIRIWLTFMLCCTLTSICMELVYQQAFVAWKMIMEELLCQYILGILKIQAYYILKKVMEKKLLNFKNGKRGKIVDEEIIKFQKQ